MPMLVLGAGFVDIFDSKGGVTVCIDNVGLMFRLMGDTTPI